jgi:tetratricopeptide (TPR) repeat protein
LSEAASNPSLWADDLAGQVVDYLIWHGHWVAAEDTIKARLKYEPLQPMWLTRLGDLYSRKQQWLDAVTAYEQAIALPGTPVSAYLGLAQAQLGLSEVEESEVARWELKASAIQNLETYRQLAPDDLKALVILSQLYPPASPVFKIIREELRERLCDEYVVTDLLGLEPGEVNLGDNVLMNSSFEISLWDVHNWSRWSNVDAPGSEEAAYDMGVDRFVAFEGQQSARVMIFWTTTTGRDPARIGYQARAISLAPTTCYLTRFVYRTSLAASAKVGALLTGGEADPEAFPWLSYLWFPNTEGAWRAVYIVGCNMTQDYQSASFLLVQSGAGDAHVDAVAIRPLALKNGIPISIREAPVWVVK